ncbi:filaggrin-2 [Triticum aestivum]|uniref:filaggrin-2 n=1 Tax=Triticum aestivum TaxID=4565 RepID=UPI001D03122D|nr:filaggrin-2-like [Triticum aestivum]
MEHQGHGTGEKKSIMSKIKEKLSSSHGDHQPAAATHGQQGHTTAGTHGTPVTDGAYGQHGHTGATGTGMHGADTGEKKGVVENINDKLPGDHEDHQQTGGTNGQQGHTVAATHGASATGGTYGQQGNTGMGTHGTPATDSASRQHKHTGSTGTGMHDTDISEKKGVMENINEKLPGGHGDHQQTGGTYGQKGHMTAATHGASATGAPATDGAYGQHGHTRATGTGMHGVDTGEKKGNMENIDDKLPGGHGDHQQTAGTHGHQGHIAATTHGASATDDTYGQQGNTSTGTHAAPATDGAYGQHGHTGATGTGMDGADIGEKKGVMENINDKLSGGHGDHQQTGGTYEQQGHTDAATHGASATSGTYGQQENTGTGTHGAPATDGAYGQHRHTGAIGTGLHGADTGEKKGDMENIDDKLPDGHGDHQQTAGTYGHQGHTAAATHGASPTDDTYGQQGSTSTGTHAAPATDGAYGQHEHTEATGTGMHGADIGEKKGVMENINDKLSGGHGDHEQTGGTYGQQGHTDAATHGASTTSGTYGQHENTGTGTHGAPATDGAYGQHGHTGAIGTGLHGANTGEKKGVKENINDKLPDGRGDHQQTGGTYGQQEHIDAATHGALATGGTNVQQGNTGTGTHGAPATDGAYGQHKHTGATGTRMHDTDTSEKKGVMENINDKLPSGDEDHQHTGGTYGQQGQTGAVMHGQQGHTEMTGWGTHGNTEKKGVMDDIKPKLPGGHDDRQQTGDTYEQQRHTDTATHGTLATGDTYGQQGHTDTGTYGTGEKKGAMGNIKEKLPGGHGDHQQTGGTYGSQEDTEMTGMGMHSTTATDDTDGQQGHTRMTGTVVHDTDERKGVMENFKEKLPDSHDDHQQTARTDGHHAGTGTHDTPATDGTYGQHGHTRVTDTEAYSTGGTGEKKGIMKNTKEKLPGGHNDRQQTGDTFGQQGHTDTATHGTPSTGGTYGQHEHTGVTDKGTQGTGGIDKKKDAMENIKEKLPGGHGDHQQTAGTYGQHGHTGMTGTETHGTTATDGGQQGHNETTGTGTHGTDGTGEKKSFMDKIKEKLPGLN